RARVREGHTESTGGRQPGAAGHHQRRDVREDLRQVFPRRTGAGRVPAVDVKGAEGIVKGPRPPGRGPLHSYLKERTDGRDGTKERGRSRGCEAADRTARRPGKILTLGCEHLRFGNRGISPRDRVVHYG